MKVDMDGSGMLNFPEFLAMMGYKVVVELSGRVTDILQAECENAEDEIREAFQVFDGVTIPAWHLKDDMSLFRITFFNIECKAF